MSIRPANQTRFEVVRRSPMSWAVDRVRSERGEVLDRYTVCWFFTQKGAEQCAQGLAFRTWTKEGPIVASYDLVEPVDLPSTGSPTDD